jgi:CheY-like chemotaxis protein
MAEMPDGIPSPTASAARAVLVVDDDPDVRAIAAQMFEMLGLVVLQASSGPEALRFLTEHPEIAVLFSDVRMPGMSGAELAAEARKLRPGLRVVLTSGYTGGVDGAKLRDMHVLPKPWRLNEIAALIPVHDRVA